MLCDTRKDILIVDCLNAFPPLCALGSDTRNVSKQHFWMIKKKNVFCSMLMVISWYGKFIHTKILVYFVMHEAGQKPVHVEYIKRQLSYGKNMERTQRTKQKIVADIQLSSTFITCNIAVWQCRKHQLMHTHTNHPFHSIMDHPRASERISTSNKSSSFPLPRAVAQ